jgi:hypothetical protein
MAVGIIVPFPASTLHPAFIASKAEALGFESIWYHEHPILPVDSASPFPAMGGEIPWTYRHFSEPYIGLDHGIGHLVSMTSQKRSDSTAVRVETRKLPRHP